MEFCDKCGGMMIPNKEGLACSMCSHKKSGNMVSNEKMKSKEIHVLENQKEIREVVDEKCSKCGNKQAHFWTMQTRASDEPETKFFECTKCKHKWRDYK